MIIFGLIILYICQYPYALTCIYVVILLKLIFLRGKVLTILLILELLATIVVWSVNNLTSEYGVSQKFIFMFFCLSVIEAAIGLGILIKLSRDRSSKTLSSF